MASAGGSARARHRSKPVARGGGKQRGIGTAGLAEFADVREVRDLLPGFVDDEDDEATDDVVEAEANEDQYSEQVSYGRDADDEAEDEVENDWRSGEALDRPGLWVEPEPAIVIDRYGSHLVARPASSEYAVAERARTLRAIGQFLAERLSAELMTGDLSLLDAALAARPMTQVELARWLREHSVPSAGAVVSKAVKAIIVRVHGVGRVRLSWFFRGDARLEGARESPLVEALLSAIRQELVNRPKLTTAALAEVVRRQLGRPISNEAVRRHRNKMGLAAREPRAKRGRKR